MPFGADTNYICDINIYIYICTCTCGQASRGEEGQHEAQESQEEAQERQKQALRSDKPRRGMPPGADTSYVGHI